MQYTVYLLDIMFKKCMQEDHPVHWYRDVGLGCGLDPPHPIGKRDLSLPAMACSWGYGVGLYR